jgi:transformer-2 protein
MVRGMIDGMYPLYLGEGNGLMRRSGGRDDRGPPPAEANQGNNLHVSGLAKSVDVPMLEEAFGKIGKVATNSSVQGKANGQIYKVEIMQDPHTRTSPCHRT